MISVGRAQIKSKDNWSGGALLRIPQCPFLHVRRGRPTVGAQEVDPPLQRRQRRHLHLSALGVRPGLSAQEFFKVILAKALPWPQAHLFSFDNSAKNESWPVLFS